MIAATITIVTPLYEWSIVFFVLDCSNKIRAHCFKIECTTTSIMRSPSSLNSHAIRAAMDGITDGSVTPQQQAICTKPDLRLAATQQLYEAANRLDNVANELKSYLSVFLDQNSSHQSIEDSVRKMNRTIIPSIEKVECVLNSSGKHIAPIASVKTICDRKNRALLKEIIDPGNKRKSPNIQILEHYTSSSNCVKPKQTNVVPKRKRDGQVRSNKTVDLPPPAHGSQYSRL